MYGLRLRHAAECGHNPGHQSHFLQLERRENIKTLELLYGSNLEVWVAQKSPYSMKYMMLSSLDRRFRQFLDVGSEPSGFGVEASKYSSTLLGPQDGKRSCWP